MSDWKVVMMMISFHEIDVLLLTDMDISENNCPELTQKTADALDDGFLQELFISIQRNNLDLCVKSALQ